MKANKFRNHIEIYARKWLSDTMNVEISSKTGIDLSDEEIGIEMKCRLNKYATNYPVHEYQVRQFEEDNSQKELFWGFLSYGLSRPIKKVRCTTDLSKIVTDIEVRFIGWDWIKQFPIAYVKTGPYIYAHSKDFPEDGEFNTYSKNGGKLYLPKGSILEEKINHKSNQPPIQKQSAKCPF